MSATLVLKGKDIIVNANTTHSDLHKEIRKIMPNKFSADTKAEVELSLNGDPTSESKLFVVDPRSPSKLDPNLIKFDNNTYFIIVKAFGG